MQKLVNKNIPSQGADVFACSARISKILIALRESSTSLIGQLFWIGGAVSFIPYARESREFGKSSWTLKKKMKYFADSIFSFTQLPIALLHFLGFVGLFVSVISGIIIAIERVTGKIHVPGYTALILALTTSTSIIVIALAILGSYISRIYENTKFRPQSIVKEIVYYGN
jgi:hypothetical protein